MQNALGRNLRLYPWYLATTYESLSHAVWYLFLFSYKGMSLEQMALLALLGDGVIVLAEVPTGWLADRLGRRLSMLLGIVAQAASFLLFIYGTDFWTFWLSMAVCGLGDTLRGGADSALLYDSCLALGQRERYRPLLSRATFLGQLGLVVGTVAGGTLATRFFWELPLWVDLGLSAIGFGIVLSMREPPRLSDGEPEEEEAGSGSGPAIQLGEPPPALLHEPHAESSEQPPAGPQPKFGRVLARLFPVLLFAATFAVVPELAGFHLPSELENTRGLTPEQLGWLYALFELVYALGAKLAGHRRIETLRFVMPAAAFISLGALALMGQRELLGLVCYIAARSGVDFLYGFMWPLLSDEANRRVPSSVRATSLSVLNAAERIVPLALLPLSVLIVARSSYAAMYVGFALALAVPLALSAWLVLRRSRAAGRL